MEALAAGLPFMTCLGGVPGDLPLLVVLSVNASPFVVFLRLKRPIGTGFVLSRELEMIFARGLTDVEIEGVQQAVTS